MVRHSVKSCVLHEAGKEDPWEVDGQGHVFLASEAAGRAVCSDSSGILEKSNGGGMDIAVSDRVKQNEIQTAV